jgi:hypothetical protein
MRAEGVWQNFHTTGEGWSDFDTRWANVTLSDGTNIGIGQEITDEIKFEKRFG